jgi:hypothetical protein
MLFDLHSERLKSHSEIHSEKEAFPSPRDLGRLLLDLPAPQDRKLEKSMKYPVDPVHPC